MIGLPERKIYFLFIIVTCLFQQLSFTVVIAGAETNSEKLFLVESLGAESGKIRSVAISPDGGLIAISDSAEMRVWNGNEFTAKFNASQVNSLVFSPDGRLLVGGGYKQIYIWDLSEGKLLKSIDAHDNLITALAFSPDGTLLASGSKGSDPVVKLWDVKKLNFKKALRWEYSYSEQVLALTFSRDGNLLASASLDHNVPVRIWDINNYHATPISFQDGFATKLAFSPTGEYLLAGLSNNKIAKIAYHKSGRNLVSILKAHAEKTKITDIAFTLNGDYLISGDDGGKLAYWDTGSWKVAKTLYLPAGAESLMIAADVSTIAVIEKKKATFYLLPDFFEPEIILLPNMQASIKTTNRELSIKASPQGKIPDSRIRGIVNDESKIARVLINGVEAKLTRPSFTERINLGIRGRGVIFSSEVPIHAGNSMIEIVAVDVFENKATDYNPWSSRTDIRKTTANLIPPGDNGMGNYYALVIGNNSYEYLKNLKTAENDATSVAKVLSDEYGFKTELLLNGSRTDILGSLNRFRKTLTRDDNLLIYYAGHGHFDKETEKAYWLPVEAKSDDTTNWIIVDNITANIKKISANHILVVADSCYSGTLTRNTAAKINSTLSRDRYLKRMFEKKSRTLMSSGGNEPVADGGGGGKHSVFADIFIRALKEMNRPVFTADELFSEQSIKESVTGRSEQTPDYEYIRNSGHDHGDFIFTRKEQGYVSNTR